MQKWVYFFGDGQAEGGTELKEFVGGKGASLAEMTRAGLQVPPGFTISAECCDHYFRNDRRWPDGLVEQVREGLDRLEQLSGRRFGRGANPLLLAVRSGAAQSMPGMMDTVLNVGLNPACVRAVALRTGDARGAWEAYLHFQLMYARTVSGIDPGALDSAVRQYLNRIGKSLDDDLEASALETLCLNIATLYHATKQQSWPSDPWQMLCEAINAVFESWQSDRAVTYRQHHKIEGLVGTAVTVQMMCPSEVSGVLFTADPVDPSLPQMVIEASYGLGEAVVLGKVTPDRFVLDKTTLAVKQREIGRKEQRVAALVEGDVGAPGRSEDSSLTGAQVRELAELGRRVEEYFGHPCDVEWGLSQGRFYLLQARPIRAKPAAHSASIDPAERERVRQEEIAALRATAAPDGTVWSRFNLYEILPEPTPMTWAIVRRFMSGQGGYGLMYRDLGFDPHPVLDEEGVFDLVCGRPYCNLSREPRMQYRSLPFEHPLPLLRKHPAKAMYPQAVPNWAKAGWKFWLFLPAVFWKLARANTRLRQVSQTFADDFERRIVPPFLTEVETAGKEDCAAKSDAELLRLLEHWTRRTLIDFARDSLKPTALAAVALGNLERALAVRFQPAGQPRPDEAGQMPGLRKAQEALRELVMGVHPPEETDLPGGIRALREKRLSREEFLRRFGHRGSQEMELARPRWAEDHLALDLLTRGGRAEMPAPPDPAAVWERVANEAKIAPHHRPAVEAELRTLQRFLALRESAKHHLLRGYALIRRVLVELDRRHALDGDVFFLEPAELPRLAAEREQLRALAAQRRRRREIALSLAVPQVLFSDDLDAIGRPADLQGAAVLQGTPLSAGVVEAKAWVLDKVDDAAIPEEPYILVCPSTDPAWVPLFVQARGLVMETGGVLSHGAIVAREFGLPAVAGIADVHRRLKTGQVLRLDGGSGTVSIVSG